MLPLGRLSAVIGRDLEAWGGIKVLTRPRFLIKSENPLLLPIGARRMTMTEKPIL
jgi:hypothetical protein